jgi:hypothetical protein
MRALLESKKTGKVFLILFSNCNKESSLLFLAIASQALSRIYFFISAWTQIAVCSHEKDTIN